jgi:hypothetical protein
MKEYLDKLLSELIQRCYVLKTLIKYPLKYSEFDGLAERCTHLIDSYIQDLKFLKRELSKFDNEGDLRIIFREYRQYLRLIEIVEHSGISVLNLHNDEMVFLNKLLRKIQLEINLPLSPPHIACFSNRYYFYQPLTNVIFTPLGESKFLLHLPDLFHELGHYISTKREEIKLTNVKKAYSNCLKAITEHYYLILRKQLSEVSPGQVAEITAGIHTQWKESWFEEFFCDVFATCLLGPAYVWSHLHLVTKKVGNVFEFNWKAFSTHPADEARLRIMTFCLDILGFKDAVQEILKQWNSLIVVKDIKPLPEYYEAYPDIILKMIAQNIINSIKDSDFSVYSKEKYSQIPNDDFINVLNEAWNVFWKGYDKFKIWESEKMDKLTKELNK